MGVAMRIPKFIRAQLVCSLVEGLSQTISVGQGPLVLVRRTVCGILCSNVRLEGARPKGRLRGSGGAIYWNTTAPKSVAMIQASMMSNVSLSDSSTAGITLEVQ